MVDTTIKTKAAMLHELESIKGLLLEDDDIPILQEVEDIEPQRHASPSKHEPHITFSHARTENFETAEHLAEAVSLATPNIEALNLKALNSEALNSEALNSEALNIDIPNLETLNLETLNLKTNAKAAHTETSKIQASKIATLTSAPRVIVEEQQDFFAPPASKSFETTATDSHELLDTLEELEKHTAEVTANKLANELHKPNARPSLAKATGENPFLPAHIRSRLHGNNPPPLFAQETARKIASTSVPTRMLGNTSVFANQPKMSNTRQDLIDSIVDKLMPDIERELRSRLETMSRQLLDELNKQ